MGLDLTIGVACYRGAHLLQQLLRSIVHCAWHDRCEVVIWDDASPPVDAKDISQAVQDEQSGSPRILGVNSTNLGCVATYNRIFQVARGPLVALIDNDVILPSQWIRTALELRHAMPANVGVLSWKSIKMYYPDPGFIDNAGSGGPLLEPATELAGYCFLLSKNLWAEMKGFDEGFRNYQGDSDMCARLWSAGHKSYRVHYPIVGHQEHATLGLYPEETQADPKADMAHFKTKWGASSAQVQRDLVGS